MIINNSMKGGNMLTITDDARKVCHDTIAQLADPEADSKCLRLQNTEKSGLMLTFDEPRKSDAIIRYDGRDLIAVPENYATFCADKTLGLDDRGRLFLS